MPRPAAPRALRRGGFGGNLGLHIIPVAKWLLGFSRLAVVGGRAAGYARSMARKRRISGGPLGRSNSVMAARMVAVNTVAMGGGEGPARWPAAGGRPRRAMDRRDVHATERQDRPPPAFAFAVDVSRQGRPDRQRGQPPGRSIDERGRKVEGGLRIGEMVLDRLVRTDRFAELVSLGDVRPWPRRRRATPMHWAAVPSAARSKASSGSAPSSGSAAVMSVSTPRRRD